MTHGLCTNDEEAKEGPLIVNLDEKGSRFQRTTIARSFSCTRSDTNCYIARVQRGAEFGFHRGTRVAPVGDYRTMGPLPRPTTANSDQQYDGVVDPVQCASEYFRTLLNGQSTGQSKAGDVMWSNCAADIAYAIADAKRTVRCPGLLLHHARLQH